MCVSAWMLVPGLKVVWFSWGFFLGYFVACFPVVGLNLWVFWVAFARVVGGCGVWFSCDCYPVCGVRVWFVFPLPDVQAWMFACWYLLVFVSGCCPFSYVYRGGAVRFLLSLEALPSCILGCLWGIALLVINS